jgi:DNA-binding transcriptional regulator YiaG
VTAVTTIKVSKDIWRDSYAELSQREVFGVLRRRHGIRQGDLSEATGIAQSTLSLWERGRMDLSPEHVSQLWSALRDLEADGEAAGEVA